MPTTEQDGMTLEAYGEKMEGYANLGIGAIQCSQGFTTYGEGSESVQSILGICSFAKRSAMPSTSLNGILYGEFFHNQYSAEKFFAL